MSLSPSLPPSFFSFLLAPSSILIVVVTVLLPCSIDGNGMAQAQDYYLSSYVQVRYDPSCLLFNYNKPLVAKLAQATAIDLGCDDV